MSDRLMVRETVKCDCESLRTEVRELQSRIQDLSVSLKREKERNAACSTMSLEDATTRPQLLQLPMSTGTQGPEPEASVSTSKNLTDWILAPTFTGGTGERGADISGSAWRLWNNDASTEALGPQTTSLMDVPMTEYGQDLIDVYFDNYWAHLPLLHRPTFLAQHYYPISQGLVGKVFSEFQVYMVFAIAACEKPNTAKGYSFSHREFFQKAIGTLGAVMTSSDLDCIQCLLLLCIYGRSEPQSVNMWHITGLVLRTALGIDLHRQESVSKDNVFEAEMAKRLFWSAYVLDRSIAMAMCRPLGIEDSDITVSLPLQYTDEQLSSHDPQLVAPLGLPDAKDTSTFIHVIKIRRINAQIYKTFHSAGYSNSAEDLEALRLQYYGQLNEWLITAPRYFLATSMFQSAEWFQIAYHHANLSLHRPSHATPVPSIEALRLCIDSSISLISSYASLYAKNKVSYSFIAFNSIVMAALTMLYAMRASPFVRQQLTKTAVETNVATCLSLFRGVSHGRAIAERCSAIVKRLGNATLSLFDEPHVSDNHVDMEFLSWFGLKSHQSSQVANLQRFDSQTLWQQEDGAMANLTTTPSVDGAWRDLFEQGFGWEGFGPMDIFPGPVQ